MYSWKEAALGFRLTSLCKSSTCPPPPRLPPLSSVWGEVGQLATRQNGPEGWEPDELQGQY